MECQVLVIRCLLHLILFLAYLERAIGLGSELSKCTHNGEDNIWLCRGDDLLRVPSNLTSNSAKMVLKLEDAGIKVLLAESLSPYAKVLWKLYLVNAPEFHTFEPGIFHNITKLQTIYISDAPKLTYIHEEVFNVRLPQLKEIRIIRTGLLHLPYLGNLITNEIMKTVDFENNYIRHISTAWIKIRSEDLLLNYNKIHSVDKKAFSGSRIGKLSLRGNIPLTNIDAEAFVGLMDINVLDLSETSITTLPTEGLEGLTVLNIKNTKTLKVFPSVYKFEAILKANLTYPYHCCAFRFPAKHDPEMHKKHEDLIMKAKEACIKAPMNMSCDTVISKPQNITCYPEPDAFNPCEDIMGYWGLRIAVWLVAISAILGNSVVLIILVFSKEMTVSKFLMCNLAFADLCMGIYLIFIAGMDAHSIGEYFNHAIDWQTGFGCQVAGFLTVFSTELSIFTLTIITCERWYTITYAINLTRRLTLKTSTIIMIVGWIYSSIMASLPLADISGYSKTSICLPLANRNNTDLLYLITLLIFNALAFLVIVIGYGHMYSSIQHSREEATPTARSDMRIAKRMALLILTDFVCWAPIAFFAITALAGRPLISVTQTKILLVFVYPLNSCANPYLYALLTQQYRRDALTLLARYGICKNRAAKYRLKTVGVVIPTGDQHQSCNRNITNNNSRQRCISTVVNPIPTSTDIALTTKYKNESDLTTNITESEIIVDNFIANNSSGLH